MSDIRDRRSMSDVAKGLGDLKKRTESCAVELERSSGNLETLMLLSEELNAGLPEDSARLQARALRTAYYEGRRDYRAHDSRLEEQLSQEAHEVTDTASAAREAGSDSHRLERAAREMGAAPTSGALKREADRLRDADRELENVARQAADHVAEMARRRLETQKRLRKSGSVHSEAQSESDEVKRAINEVSRGSIGQGAELPELVIPDNLGEAVRELGSEAVGIAKGYQNMALKRVEEEARRDERRRMLEEEIHQRRFLSQRKFPGDYVWEKPDEVRDGYVGYPKEVEDEDE